MWYLLIGQPSSPFRNEEFILPGAGSPHSSQASRITSVEDLCLTEGHTSFPRHPVSGDLSMKGLTDLTLSPQMRHLRVMLSSDLLWLLLIMPFSSTSLSTQFCFDPLSFTGLIPRALPKNVCFLICIAESVFGGPNLYTCQVKSLSN